MENPSRARFQIGKWTVEPSLNRLTHGEKRVSLRPRHMDALVFFASHQGMVFSADALVKAVWGEVVVGDDAVYQCISRLREALGDDTQKPRFIQTIPKRGYRFIAGVAAEEDASTDRKPVAGIGNATIAVLPFKNLSGDPEQKYFVSGMHDLLIADLSKFAALKIISRTSTERYSETSKSLPQIGAELGADKLVEGSVYRVDERVRITVQLIDAATDEHLWAEQYERALTDVLLLQAEVAQAIAEQIKIRIEPEEEARLGTTRKVDPGTYNTYLRGMYFVNKATPQETAKGLAILQKSVEVEPANALAWAGLSLGHLLAAHGPEPPLDAYDRAKAAADRALALDDTLAEAYAARAETQLYSDWNWDGAAEDFRRALSINPNMAATRAHYSWSLNLRGEYRLGLAEMRRAIELDPCTPLWLAWLGWQNWEAGHYELAVHHCREALELVPDFPVALFAMGGALAWSGAYLEAIDAHTRAAAVSHDWDQGLAEVHALAGNEEKARAELARLEARATTWDTYFIARVHMILGDLDEAFRWLEIASDEPHHPYIPWIRTFVSYDAIRDDARFKALLRKIGLPDRLKPN